MNYELQLKTRLVAGRRQLAFDSLFPNLAQRTRPRSAAALTAAATIRGSEPIGHQILFRQSR